MLGRLEEQGLVASHWTAGDGGPGRKVIEATAAGREALATRRARWRQWAGLVAAVVDDAVVLLILGLIAP